MTFPGFIGAGYQLPAIQAASQECVNFYLEVIEDPSEKKSRMILQPTPCAGFISGPALYGPFRGPARGLMELNGLILGVNGSTLFQYYLPDDNQNPYGWYNQRNPNTPIAGSEPLTMIANGVRNSAQQIMIAGNYRSAYNYSVGGVLTDLSQNPDFLAGRGAAFLNDFFISLIPGTNGFQVSKQNDGTKWDQTDVAYTQGQSDELVALIADREYLWFFGGRRSEVWASASSQFFPFQNVPNAFMEIGIVAPASLVQADNTLFLLGQSKSGGKSFYKLNGFTPVRISNHAIDAALASYGDITDCIGYSFAWNGHTFIRYIFPKANKAWTYDCAASSQVGFSVWHRNRFTDRLGQSQATLERTHCYVDGIHLVGSGGADGAAGTLYKLTDKTVIDQNPVATLRVSKDGGVTYGPEYDMPVGASGDYTIRAIRRNLGAARDATFWVRCVDYGDAPPNPDGSGGFPVVRDRITPHIYDKNQWTIYRSFELNLEKGIGSQAGAVDGFFCLTNADIVLEGGE